MIAKKFTFETSSWNLILPRQNEFDFQRKLWKNLEYIFLSKMFFVFISFRVPEILNLLGRIPLLKSLQTLVTSPVVESNPVDPTLLEGEERTKEASLLDWIYQQVIYSILPFVEYFHQQLNFLNDKNFFIDDKYEDIQNFFCTQIE